MPEVKVSMSNEKKVEKGNKNFLSGLFRQQIFIPIAALIILAVFNLIVDPSFFKITLGDITAQEIRYCPAI